MKRETARALKRPRLRQRRSDYDGWLAILLWEAPEGGYEDVAAAFIAACRRHCQGERIVIRRQGDSFIRIR